MGKQQIPTVVFDPPLRLKGPFKVVGVLMPDHTIAPLVIHYVNH